MTLDADNFRWIDGESNKLSFFKSRLNGLDLDRHPIDFHYIVCVVPPIGSSYNSPLPVVLFSFPKGKTRMNIHIFGPP